MDVLTYQYPKYANTQANIDVRLAGKMINNRMRYVLDEATSNYADDIKSNAPLTITTRQNVKDELAAGQGSDNYAYDEIGNLIKDTKEAINNIAWNVYGKIQSINKGGNIIAYTYDASGNRISKTAAGKTTIYVRDASGNVMSVYTADPAINSGNLMQNEVHLYGSSRLGIYNINRNVQTFGIANYLNNINTFTRGNKFFELSNHVGNVLVTVSDKKIGVDSDADGIINYYSADIATANDYYPFGMTMPGRKYKQPNSTYRYGFNGKENDNEVKGEGNQQDYGMRIYDPRIAKFLSIDPLSKKYPFYTPYQFAGNSPILSVDIDGMEGEKNPNYTEATPIPENLRGGVTSIPDIKYDKGTEFGIGILKTLFTTLGGLSEIPARMHYEDKIRPENKATTFPLTNGQDFRDWVTTPFTAPIYAIDNIILKMIRIIQEYGVQIQLF